MKTPNDVLARVGQLIQGEVASPSGEIVSAQQSEGSVIVTAADKDSGLRKQYRLSCEEVTETPPPAENTAQEGECCEGATTCSEASGPTDASQGNPEAGDQQSDTSPAEAEGSAPAESRQPETAPAAG